MHLLPTLSHMPAVNGHKLRELRRPTGLKPEEFAVAARVAGKTVRNIECKERSQPVAIEVVHRFAKVLGVDYRELLAAEDAAA